MKHCLKMMQKISLIVACTALLLPSVGYSVPPQKPFFAQGPNGNPIVDANGIPVPHVEVPQDPKKVALALGAAGLTMLTYASLNAGSSAFMDLLYHKLSSAKEDILGVNPKDYYVDWTEQAKKIPGDEPTKSQRDVLRKMLKKMKNKGQPHAVITGASGVGKSSLVWSLAEAISNNDSLVRGTAFESARLQWVDAHKLNSGGTVGLLAKRLKRLLEAATNHWKATDERVIFFFDEFHQLTQIGNHRDSQTENVMAILKALTGNERNFKGYHILGATTQQEFDQFIEKGGPTARRFSPTLLDEPGEGTTCQILKKTAALIQKEGKVVIRNSELDAICRGCVTAAKRKEGANPDKAKKLLYELVGTFEGYHKESAPEARLRQNIQYLEMLQRNVQYRLSQDSGLLGQHGFFSPRHIIDQLASMANKPFIDETASLVQRATSHDAESQAIKRAQKELRRQLFSCIKEKEDRGQRIYLRKTALKQLKEAIGQQKLALFAVSSERQRIEDQTKARAETISEVLRLEKAVRLGAQWEFPKRPEVQWSLWNPLSYGKKIMRDAAWCCKSIAQWRRKPIEQAIEDKKTKSHNQLVELERSATIDPPVLTNEFARNYLNRQATAPRIHGRRYSTTSLNIISPDNIENFRQLARRQPARPESDYSQFCQRPAPRRSILDAELNIPEERQREPQRRRSVGSAPLRRVQQAVRAQAPAIPLAVAPSIQAHQQADGVLAPNPIDAANFARQRRQLRSFASISSDRLHLE